MADPQRFDDLKGHFKTYLEMINCSPDDLPKYTAQQMSDLGRCSICKNWHFTSITEIHRHKRLLHPKVQLQSCWKSILGVKFLIFLYVGTKLTRKIVVCRFRHITNYTNIKKSRGTNERWQRKPRMMKINAIRKRKRFLPQKKSVKNFFQKKTNKRKVNISDDETQENVDETQENPSYKNKSILTDV